jgi:hypothetical protein
MGAKKMGFQGKLYYGVAGSTGTTEIGNSQDINETLDAEKGPTTVRGTGGTPPIETSSVTSLKYSIEWTMLEDATDSTLEALKTAAVAGTPVALRGKDHAAGKGPDMDVIVTFKKGKPLKGEQTVQFSAEPNGDARAPLLYV